MLRQGPACVLGSLAMGLGWGLLASVVLRPAYVGMWVAALSVSAILLYVTHKFVKVGCRTARQTGQAGGRIGADVAGRQVDGRSRAMGHDAASLLGRGSA